MLAQWITAVAVAARATYFQVNIIDEWERKEGEEREREEREERKEGGLKSKQSHVR